MSMYDLYMGLPEAIRKADELDGQFLLKRFLAGPQEQRDLTEDSILTLKDQVVPSRMRDDLVQWLKDMVGFTRELADITDRLAVDQVRRLIQLAVPLWNQRFTELGIINIIRLLTSRPCIVFDWFAWRLMVGEAHLTENRLLTGGDAWVVGGTSTPLDEYWSNVRIMDDGTLDEILVLDLLSLMRPSGERIEVNVLDFLDVFDRDMSLWEMPNGDPPPDIVSRRAILPSGVEMAAVMPILDAANMKDYSFCVKFNLASVDSQFYVRWYLNDARDTYMAANIRTLGAPVYKPRITINYLLGGAGPVFGVDHDSTEFQLVSNLDYMLRVESFNGNVKIAIDGFVIVDEAIQGGINAGKFSIGNSGPDNVSIGYVESYRIPGRQGFVQLGTVNEPRGAKTMSANFIE